MSEKKDNSLGLNYSTSKYPDKIKDIQIITDQKFRSSIFELIAPKYYKYNNPNIILIKGTSQRSN